MEKSIQGGRANVSCEGAHTTDGNGSSRNYVWLRVNVNGKLAVFIVADDQRIKGMATRISADNKLLAAVDSVLEPCAQSLSRLVDGIFSFRDNSLKGMFLYSTDKICRRRLKGFRQPDEITSCSKRFVPKR